MSARFDRLIIIEAGGFRFNLHCMVQIHDVELKATNDLESQMISTELIIKTQYPKVHSLQPWQMMIGFLKDRKVSVLFRDLMSQATYMTTDCFLAECMTENSSTLRLGTAYGDSKLQTIFIFKTLGVQEPIVCLG